jgi:hypothetical protein
MDRKRQEGYWSEEQKKLEEQKEFKIKLNDRQCIECGKKISLGTMSAYEMEFSSKNGAHCKKCMEEKLRISQPWRRRE